MSGFMAIMWAVKSQYEEFGEGQQFCSMIGRFSKRLVHKIE